MTAKNLPDWHSMTPQDLADLSVDDEATYLALSTANWSDWEWHNFKHESWQLAPRECVTPLSEGVATSEVWFKRRWRRMQ
jgi:hypothetical protein